MHLSAIYGPIPVKLLPSANPLIKYSYDHFLVVLTYHLALFFGQIKLGYFCPTPPKCILRNDKYKTSNVYIPVFLGVFCCSEIIMAPDSFSLQ